MRAALLCMCVAFAALGTAAACVSKKPSGTAADQDALLTCTMSPNISHATFTCSAAAMLEGVDYEVVTNTSCNQVQRYAQPHAPADCGFEMVFPRPSTCGSGHGDGAEGVQNIDVSLDAHVVQHGGTITLGAGVSGAGIWGSVSVPRSNTSTTLATASWLLQGNTSVTYASRTLQVPCENPGPLPIVADIGTVFSLAPVASSDRLVEGSITMTDTSGDKYASTVSSLRVSVYPQVAQSVPLDTVLAMAPQVFELVVDGEMAEHESAFGMNLGKTPKTQHDLPMWAMVVTACAFVGVFAAVADIVRRNHKEV